jgi:hypothetical protein
VEQTLGILSFHRRLVRDYEHRLSSSASRVYWAMTDVMARRADRHVHAIVAAGVTVGLLAGAGADAPQAGSTRRVS